jgi:hypothetical protein
VKLLAKKHQGAEATGTREVPMPRGERGKDKEITMHKIQEPEMIFDTSLCSSPLH